MIDNNSSQIVDFGVSSLKSGQLILCPTDSLYSVSCDAFNSTAIEKMLSLENRNTNNDFIILVESDRMLQQCIKNVSDLVWDLIEYSNSPLTLVLEANASLPKGIANEDGTIGIRYIKNGICKEIIRKLNRPILSTSPNTSKQADSLNFKNIDEKIKNACEYVVPEAYAKEMTHKPSKIVKIMEDGQVKIIRK